MRKIHLTWQCFKASGRHGDLIEKKQKTRFQIRSMGVYVPNFRSVSFFVWSGDVTQINKYIHKYTHICSPHVDFEKKKRTKGPSKSRVFPVIPWQRSSIGYDAPGSAVTNLFFLFIFLYLSGFIFKFYFYLPYQLKSVSRLAYIGTLPTILEL